MHEVANFIGEWGGDSWNTQGVAVVLAAVAASLAGGFTAWVAITQGHKTRSQEREIKSREQWWDRFQWAADLILTDHERQRIAGARIMSRLGTMRWMDKDDRLLSAVMLAMAREDADISPLIPEARKV